MKDLLKKLIQADSTVEKGEIAAAQVIAAEFARAGLDCCVDTWDRNRANVVAHVKSAANKAPLLFACHLDVVGPGEGEWQYQPFDGVERDGRIFGRGSTDMKGGIAAAVTAICQVVQSLAALKGDIVFAAVAGEETDSCGAKRFVNEAGWLGKPLGAIVPEPTDFDVVTAHRGLLWLNVTTKGKAAHGSAPNLGINAISLMKRVLDELEGYKIHFEPHPFLGGCSMSINTIAGGKALNVVPDRCTLGIDIRTLPNQSHDVILADFNRILGKLKAADPHFEADASVVRQADAMETDNHCAFVRDFCSAVGVTDTKAVGFTTDGPYFAELGAPVVIFGPGKGELCHKPDEYIDIVDVEKAVEHYKNIILRFLG